MSFFNDIATVEKRLTFNESSFLLTALMVSALPVKADDTGFENRLEMIGILTSADCVVKNGAMTEEQASELIQRIVNDNPNLNTAYSWAITSNKATEAVEIMVTYMNSHCNDLTISEEEAARLIRPYLD